MLILILMLRNCLQVIDLVCLPVICSSVVLFLHSPPLSWDLSPCQYLSGDNSTLNNSKEQAFLVLYVNGGEMAY